MHLIKLPLDYILTSHHEFQEMANPLVCPHLHFYPEEAGSRLYEARQGSHWLPEVLDLDPDGSHRSRQLLFFFTSQLCSVMGIPVRWFQRKGELVAKCWKMALNTEGTRMVFKESGYEVSATFFMKIFPSLCGETSIYGVPDLRNLTCKFFGTITC